MSKISSAKTKADDDDDNIFNSLFAINVWKYTTESCVWCLAPFHRLMMWWYTESFYCKSGCVLFCCFPLIRAWPPAYLCLSLLFIEGLLIAKIYFFRAVEIMSLWWLFLYSHSSLEIPGILLCTIQIAERNILYHPDSPKIVFLCTEFVRSYACLTRCIHALGTTCRTARWTFWSCHSH